MAAVTALISGPHGKRLAVGVGDDAAAWRPSRSNLSVISTDAAIEGVHFTLNTMAPRDLGARALGAALSDLAAMGARPVLATIAMGLPHTVSVSFVCELYRGLNALALKTRTVIAGGDIVRAPGVSLCVTVVGEVSRAHLKRRSDARAGDVLAVTGLLGASRAGLRILQQPQLLASADARDEPAMHEAVRIHRTPEPRLREGAWLAASTSVHAMMDLSDGLSTDLARMCRASGCSAEIQVVPVAQAARHVAKRTGEDADAFALGGGEDFELLLAVRKRSFAHLARRFHVRFRRELHCIGAFIEGTGVFLRTTGARKPLESSGWDHLAR
ncbi:MAG: thiamine-phosphate kinase [Candidatus Eremiobacteraeota bacterium]|nr:thiamine-phosphate kinase [Candidatus Eremiobacteraeota bacterium]